MRGKGKNFQLSTFSFQLFTTFAAKKHPINPMKRLYLFFASLIFSITVLAQAPVQLPTTLEGWADRLSRFGQAIPQEKVFVHMDNTCYFLGDTIWYKAFTRRTDKDIPSNVSRVLYVELFNQEGYLMERQLVEMINGEGHGSFALADTLYGGFYELRAYTRWQLNWGVIEKEHTSYAEEWFFSKALAKEFYRDYEKLYSRVFPVYDKPKTPGEFFHDMTSRPLRRYFKSSATEPQLTLTLYPEGGHFVAGVPCRVAFEAVDETGKWLEGKLSLQTGNQPLTVKDERDEEVTEVAAGLRGRGSFTFTPQTRQRYTALFTNADGQTVKTDIKSVEDDGVALQVRRDGNDFVFNISPQGAAAKPLGITVQHEGKVVLFKELENGRWTMDKVSVSDLPAGVNQLTVFDADGRIWADRLFFVVTPQLMQPSLTISGIKEDYQPYEQVDLQVTAPYLAGKAGGGSLSLAVRDASTSDYIYDSGNILTEMLLSSEIRGFVPQPQYFFEADDEEHRTALDLLMMTQGWRRFDWKAMATPGAFELTQPAESQTRILRGQVLNYQARILQDDVTRFDDVARPYELEVSASHILPGEEQDFIKSLRDSMPSAIDAYEDAGLGEIIETIIAEADAKGRAFPAGSYQMRAPIATARYNANESPLKNEVRVHAEFAQEGSEAIIGDVETRKSLFNIPSPYFQGYCVFFLAASDTTKWKDERHTWISMDETQDAEFYVRLSWPYPRFTKIYDHYQTSYREAPADAPQATQTSFFNPKTFETQMGGLTVRAKRGGLRRFDPSHPAMVIDAYEAYNEACDAGLADGNYGGRIHFINNVARTFVGDMNTQHAYLLEPRYDGRNISYNRSPAKMNVYNQLTNLDSVAIYTDFNPRYGGDPRATEDNIERVSIDVRRMPDEGSRVTYRDRRYILQGFNVAEDFYHPNYSQHPLPKGQQDYRRTLYWNPDLKLDDEGRATVTFFTGSRPTTIAVDANGQAADGTLLSN